MSVAKFMHNHVISFLLGNVCPKVIFQKYLVGFGKFSSSSRKLLSLHRRHLSLSSGISKPLSEIHFENNHEGEHLPENKYVEMRTHSCGSLNEKDVGTSVRLCGWLQFSRMGRFLLLRDSYGVTQVLISDKRKDLKEKLTDLPFESVVAVTGEVALRPAGQERADIRTGRIEVIADDVTVLNPAKKDIPFSIREYNKAKETLQMKHRYLSLRFAELQHNLRLRSHFVNAMREFLIKKCAFVEVETPTLFRRTPGGAQEFIVPTQRPGHFYSLVQSPQQLKQMLMVGAIDRYFQVARCYRDETARPDRQPEFTQMDIEMSFASRSDIMGLIEGLLENCWHTCVGNSKMSPFPRITYGEAMTSYGSDKPDTRFEMKLVDVTQLIQNNSFNSELQKMLKSHPSFVAVSFVVPKSLDQGHLSKNSLKKVEENLKKSMGKLPSFRLISDKASRGDGKEEDFYSLYEHLSIGHGDWILTAVGEKNEVLNFLGRMRLKVADLLESKGVQVRREGFYFLWVEDFPLFLPAESNSEEVVVLESAHHPFTQPHPDDLHLLHTQPLKVRGLHYDLVCNGCEIGGGSVRVHDAVLQCAILDILGIDKKSLSHLLEALECGCPPHAGIALGIDRMMALAVGADSVREVIAFPKGSDGQDIMSGSPSLLQEEDLNLYHITVKKGDSSNEKKI